MNIKCCGSVLERLRRRWSPLLLISVTIACGPSDRQRTDNVRIHSELGSAYLELRLSYPTNTPGKTLAEVQNRMIAEYGNMLRCSVDGTYYVTNPDPSLWNADPERSSREIAILYPVRRKNDQHKVAYCGIDFTGELRWIEDAPAWLPREEGTPK